MRLNEVKGRLHKAFIGSSCMGRSVDWPTVIKEGFDIAKVNCEGCEVFLTNLPDDVLKKVPNWVIECHSFTTLKNLYRKFIDSGFLVSYRPYHWTYFHQSVGALQRKINGNVPRTNLIILIAKLAPPSTPAT